MKQVISKKQLAKLRKEGWNVTGVKAGNKEILPEKPIKHEDQPKSKADLVVMEASALVSKNNTSSITRLSETLNRHLEAKDKHISGKKKKKTWIFTVLEEKSDGKNWKIMAKEA